MEAPQSYAEGMAHATLTLLIRAGVLDDGAVEALADELERRATWEQREEAKESFLDVARGLRVAILLGANEAPMVDPAVEHRAQYERDQMRRRTAWLDSKK